MARGKLTRDWSESTRRSENDAFAMKIYQKAATMDKPVVDVVNHHSESQAYVALAWLMSKPVITAPPMGATKTEHLHSTWRVRFLLSAAEITKLKAFYLQHPVDGMIPPAGDSVDAHQTISRINFARHWSRRFSKTPLATGSADMAFGQPA
ncbi:Aldo/keto reductase family protein [Izhakiella capsodis]|uniref:Aldo/keto reductase family protein n=1 Tax=Izhakiella capsodis TaxID=1367852 RepID=A0A1I4YK06_9GAMM|nr:Aldo/keto reductase family protein [Izhakiella capsodis]